MLSQKLRFPIKLPFGRDYPYQEANAFAYLYESTHVTVAKYIYGISGHTQAEVEDLTAETYERAWKSRRRFTGTEEAALGWLLTIARRLVIDKYRRKERHGTPSTLNEQLLMGQDDTPEQQAIIREQRQILWQLLNELPSQSREIVVLRYLVGWQVQKIAGHLNLSPNHVSTIIRRSLAKLRSSWPTQKVSAS